MKKFKVILAVLVVTVFSSGANAQKVKVSSGSIDIVKNEKNIHIEFRYDNMKVGKEEEANYTDRKVRDNNKDRPGKGDEWLKKWLGDRAEVYEPAFIKHFKKASRLELAPNAKYTLIFHTKTFEPGFNSLVERKPGFIIPEVTVVETENPSNLIAVIECGKVESRSITETYTVASRLEVSYATAGAFIGKLFR